MYGLTRATTTLIAAAAAGLLIWFATQIDDKNVGGFWAVYGLIAGAGLLMALSQLLGGWTKWGWPRLSATFLLTAFIPIAIVSLWIILAAEPGNGWFHRHVLSWSNSLHIRGLVNDLKEYVPLFALGIGLVFGFSFDTTGPRREVAAPATTARRGGFLGRRRTTDVDRDGVDDADEPVTRDRAGADGDVPVEDRDRDRVTTR
ncbi:MAG: hypothetical protein AUG91_05575 [Actinobacteria bacterium 13_1_20CM_4_69_9]|jgi:hypothetical protein|nr:MAG: hypothetical protein AUG91_05575 [Actinobacteria bacterium 13_1_20CM_4_69_9]